MKKIACIVAGIFLSIGVLADVQNIPGGSGHNIRAFQVFKDNNQVDIFFVDGNGDLKYLVTEPFKLFPFYLSDIEAAEVTNVHGSLQRDTVYYAEKIIINGITYEKGLGMHAPRSGNGEVVYDLPAGSRTFSTKIGSDINQGNGVIFSVLVGRNGHFTEVFNRHHYGNLTYDIGTINLEGYDQLKLRVNAAGGHCCDHSIWVEPLVND
uniref:NPCBM/NEW2 domain-containing protein n=1 Tax=Candidatus Kentrum sp. LFY TaxID=2126342 RepID=A0A450WCM4_9GAMM|nr:MAG: NPCBM/NEW2 domain-containing protein [Candidatus Kentron sp. LFY]